MMHQSACRRNVKSTAAAKSLESPHYPLINPLRFKEFKERRIHFQMHISLILNRLTIEKTWFTFAILNQELFLKNGQMNGNLRETVFLRFKRRPLLLESSNDSVCLIGRCHYPYKHETMPSTHLVPLKMCKITCILCSSKIT